VPYSVYRDTVATFLLAKDTINNATPITLLSVHIPDASATLYYAQYTDGQSISYFIPGTSTAQTYTPAPFEISEIANNIQGQIDSLQLTLSNVNRTIGGYLHSYDALRGCTVNILKVFKGGLTDPNSNMRDIYSIDSCTLTENTAQFTLTTKFEIQKVTLPFRTYRRDQCQWTFGGTECNPAGVNATVAAGTSCRKTIASCDITYSNISRFGGFPSIPTRRVVR